MNRTRLLLIGLAALALAACIAKQSPAAVNPSAPGFLEACCHGFIFPVAWIVSLFTDEIAIYAVPNNGGLVRFRLFRRHRLPRRRRPQIPKRR